MCRANGRRCPSHLNDIAQKARNAQRRARYAAQKSEQLSELSRQAKEQGDKALANTLDKKSQGHRTKERNAEVTAQEYQEQYLELIAVDALISDEQEVAAEGDHSLEATGGMSSEHVINADTVRAHTQKAIAALPPVFRGREYQGMSGDELFDNTTEVVFENPDLGIYKTKNVGALADLRYFNPETIRGKIVKSQIDKNSAHEDFGFRKVDRSADAYEIVSFNDIAKGKPEELEREMVKISMGETHHLTPLEKSGINTLSGKEFRNINDTLYDTDENAHMRLSDSLRRSVVRIDKSMDTGPKRQRYTYRSMTMEFSNAMNDYSSSQEWAEDKFALGEDVVFGGYQSSSPKRTGFQDFAADNGVIFEILTSEGVNITSASEHRNECEVLLPRQARYKVVGFERDVNISFGKGGDQYRSNTLVRLVAVNSKGEILDGSNADEISPLRDRTQEEYLKAEEAHRERIMREIEERL